MDGMVTFPDKYFDLAVVDVPYGIGIDKKMRDAAGTQPGNSKAPKKKYHFTDFDKESPPKEYFTELFRVSKNQIIWGANHFISKIPFDSSCWLVWDKVTAGDFSDCELAWTSFKSPVRKFTFVWNGMLQGNMKNKEHRIHPTQKPVALYTWIYQNYAKQGDKIIDTHVGSASSLIAAHHQGLDFIGFEISPVFYKDASERLNAEMAQTSLFTTGGGTDYIHPQMQIMEVSNV